MSANAIETLRAIETYNVDEYGYVFAAPLRENELAALAAVEALLDATDVPLFLECITDPRCGDCPGCRLDAARRKVQGAA